MSTALCFPPSVSPDVIQTSFGFLSTRVVYQNSMQRRLQINKDIPLPFNVCSFSYSRKTPNSIKFSMFTIPLGRLGNECVNSYIYS